MFSIFSSQDDTARLFGDRNYIYGDIRIARADRSRCLVCGQKYGDCVPHEGEFKEPDAPVMVRITQDVWRLTPVTSSKVIKIKVASSGAIMTESNALDMSVPYVVMPPEPTLAIQEDPEGEPTQ